MTHWDEVEKAWQQIEIYKAKVKNIRFLDYSKPKLLITHSYYGHLKCIFKGRLALSSQEINTWWSESLLRSFAFLLFFFFG
jgi:hypothetical protein